MVNKTATTITVNWTALNSSDADGYVVNVTSDTDTVQTVQVEGSSNNTITLNGLRIETTYNITVRAYQQLLGPASSTISVTTNDHCQTKGIICPLLDYCINFIGIYLTHNGYCYPNRSYFWDRNIQLDTDDKRLSCVLPGTNLTTGQWVRVKGDEPVDCNNSSDNDPFRCTNVTSPNATISLYLPPDQGLLEDQEGFYKCCLPTGCSSANEIVYANVFSKIMSMMVMCL